MTYFLLSEIEADSPDLRLGILRFFFRGVLVRRFKRVPKSPAQNVLCNHGIDLKQRKVKEVYHIFLEKARITNKRNGRAHTCCSWANTKMERYKVGRGRCGIAKHEFIRG